MGPVDQLALTALLLTKTEFTFENLSASKTQFLYYQGNTITPNVMIIIPLRK